MSYDDNQDAQAFPFVECFSSLPSGACQHFGLTKREILAAMAFQGIAANPTNHAALGEPGMKDLCDAIAKVAVQAADSLLAALAAPAAGKGEA